MVNTNLYILMRSINSKFVLKPSNLMYASGGFIALLNPDVAVGTTAPILPLVITNWLDSINYNLFDPNVVNELALLSSILVYSIGVMTHDTITNTHGIMENSFVFTQAFYALSPNLLNLYAPTFLNNPDLMLYIPHMLFQVYNGIHSSEYPIGILTTTVNPTESSIF